jgi:hypothetical protein
MCMYTRLKLGLRLYKHFLSYIYIISRLSESSGIQASIIDVKELKRKDKDISSDEDMDDDNCFNVDIDFPLCEKKKLRIYT